MPRRLLLAAAAALVAVAGLAAVPSTPASAASISAPPKFAVHTAGDTQAVATWQRPLGATNYVVTVSTDPAFPPAASRTLTTRKGERFAVIQSLAPGTVYYARVTATARGARTSPVRSFTTTTKPGSFGVMTYNMLCADYCVEGKRHTRYTFPWLNRRFRVVNDLKMAKNVDIVGLQEAGGYVATGWNCRTSPTSCSTPRKLAPDGKHAAYDRFCTPTQCPTRVPGGRFGGTPRQVDDIMRFLPEYGITPIVGDPDRKETGYSYLRVMWRTSTFELTRAGGLIDIDGAKYESTVRWHRKAYWAVLTQRSTGRSFFVVTAHPVSDGGVNRAEGYPAGATPSAVRADGAKTLNAEVVRLNTGKLPVIMTGDFNADSSKDGGLTVLKAAGYVDSRTAGTAERRVNTGVESYNGFDPRRMTPTGTRTQLDRVLVRPGTGGATVRPRLWWLVAPVRGSYVDNCRSSPATELPATGCWGSDHFPVVVQLE